MRPLKTLILGALGLCGTHLNAQTPLRLEFRGSVTIVLSDKSALAMIPNFSKLVSHALPAHIPLLYFQINSFDLKLHDRGLECLEDVGICVMKFKNPTQLSISDLSSGAVSVEKQYLAWLPYFVSDTPRADLMAEKVPTGFVARLAIPEGHLKAACDEWVREWVIDGQTSLLSHTLELTTNRALNPGDEVVLLADGKPLLTLRLRPSGTPMIGFASTSPLGTSGMSADDHHFLMHYASLVKPGATGNMKCKKNEVAKECPFPKWDNKRGCPNPSLVGANSSHGPRGSNCPPAVWGP
jgi:hypothetical protein